MNEHPHAGIYWLRVIFMKRNWKAILIAVTIPLAVGALASLLTGSAMQDFALLQKPPLSPPGWLFPVVWTLLYAMMGLASYLVYASSCPPEFRSTGLAFYAAQLVFNFFWSILFFRFGLYLLSFFWLLAMLVLIAAAALQFRRCDKRAFWLLVPYLVWVTFAGYLNLGIWILNR